MTYAKEQNLSRKTISAKDYVSNGLIAMWDMKENVGFNKHSSNLADGLVNLVSGEVLNINDATRYEIFDNYLKLNLVDKEGLKTTLPTSSTFIQNWNAAVDAREWTCEVISQIDNWHESLGTGQNYASRVGFSFNNTYYFNGIVKSNDTYVVRCCANTSGLGYYWQPASPYFNDYHSVKSVTLAHSPVVGLTKRWKGDLFINGKLSASAPEIPTVQVIDEDIEACGIKNPNLVVGSMIYPGTSTDRLYAVRIYNRALTPEEVAHNYEIDKIRFGI